MTKNHQNILLSTAYLPPIDYFALLSRFPVKIEQHETYRKQSYRNRCQIYSEKGLMALSIPVSKPGGNHTPIINIQIKNEDRCFLKHWRAIQSAYEPSPYFLYYKDELEEFMIRNFESLFQFNLQLIFKLADLLGITPHIELTDKFEKYPETAIDFRNSLNPKDNSPLAGFSPYIQVFSDRKGFIPNLSIIDLLFNLGPESIHYLSNLKFYNL